MTIAQGIASAGLAIGLGIGIIGMSQCTANDETQKTERFKLCLEHGGTMNWRNDCVIKGKEIPDQ
jgi:hypothetical protein